MDEELESLEAELKRLRPTSPSLQLVNELERTLSPRPRATLGQISWLLLPAAAAVAILLIRASVERNSRVQDVAMAAEKLPFAAPFKPVAAQSVVLDERDEGLVKLADGSHARRIRQSSIDRITWENPSTHASLTWTVPREEVNVVPVSFQ